TGSLCLAASSTAWRASASVSTPSSASRRRMPVRPGMLGAGFICVAMKRVQPPESQDECIAKPGAWAGGGENRVPIRRSWMLDSCQYPRGTLSLSRTHRFRTVCDKAAIAGQPRTVRHSGSVCGFIADRTRNRYGVVDPQPIPDRAARVRNDHQVWEPLIDLTTRHPGILAPSMALALRAALGVRVCTPANAVAKRYPGPSDFAF